MDKLHGWHEFTRCQDASQQIISIVSNSRECHIACCSTAICVGPDCDVIESGTLYLMDGASVPESDWVGYDFAMSFDLGSN
jgi:hypothetical protein